MTSPANTSDRETGTVERLVAEPHFDLVHLFERAVSRFEHDRDGYVTARRAILSELTRLKARADAADHVRFLPLGDNHHNAVKCPYCNPDRIDPAAERARAEALEAKLATAREALAKLLACPAIDDVDHTDPEWGDLETAEAESFARKTLRSITEGADQ